MRKRVSKQSEIHSSIDSRNRIAQIPNLNPVKQSKHNFYKTSSSSSSLYGSDYSSVSSNTSESDFEFQPMEESTKLSSPGQYYTIPSTAIPKTLNVIDADYGVFESENKNRMNFLSLFKNNKNKKENKNKNKDKNRHKNKSSILEFDLFPNDNFNNVNKNFELRAEPEVVSLQSNRDFNNINYINRQNSGPKIPIISDSESDNESDNLEYNQVKNQANYQNIESLKQVHRRSHRIIDAKGRTHEVVEEKFIEHASSPRRKNQKIIRNTHDKKTKIELEYDRMKHEVRQYNQAKENDRKKFGRLMKDYQYYYVNGISPELKLPAKQSKYSVAALKDAFHKPNLNKARDVSNLMSVPRPSQRKIKLQCPSEQSQTQNQKFSYQTSSNIQLLFSEVNFKELFSIAIPDNKSIREFHDSVKNVIYGMPFLNLIYPYLFLIGKFIPQDNEKMSVISACIGITDLFLMMVLGWFFWWVISWISFFFSRVSALMRLLGA